MAGNYAKSKGRREKGQFILIPHQCLKHENFIRLSPKAIKLFFDLFLQYNGTNNGDLTAAFSILKKRGWKSKETLFLAIDELLHYGWIIRTRIGGFYKKANLYAVTLRPINECGGKLDVKSTVNDPGDWKKVVEDWKKPPNYIRRENNRKKNLGPENRTE